MTLAVVAAGATLLAAGGHGVGTPQLTPAAKVTRTVRIFSEHLAPARVTDAPRGQERELGVRFSSGVDGRALGVVYYRVAGDGAKHTATLWDGSGRREQSGRLAGTDRTGWQRAYFARPVRIRANTAYVVSLHSSGGPFGWTPGSLAKPYRRGALTALGSRTASTSGRAPTYPTGSGAGANWFVDVLFAPDHPVAVTRPTAKPTVVPHPPTPTQPATHAPTPPPDTAPPVSAPPAAPTPPRQPPGSTSGAPLVDGSPIPAGFPGPATTGTSGSLTRHEGELRITTPGATVSNVLVTGGLVLDAPNVTVRNVRVECAGVDDFCVKLLGDSTTIEDSDIGGLADGHTDQPNVIGLWMGGEGAATEHRALRLDIHNTAHGARQDGASLLQDSYVHNLIYGGGNHGDATFLSDGSNNVVSHNTLEGGSNTAVFLQPGEGRPIRDTTIDHNYFYGPVAAGEMASFAISADDSSVNVWVTDNVFTRHEWQVGIGNGNWASWTGNTYTDGSPAT